MHVHALPHSYFPTAGRSNHEMFSRAISRKTNKYVIDDLGITGPPDKTHMRNRSSTPAISIARTGNRRHQQKCPRQPPHPPTSYLYVLGTQYLLIDHWFIDHWLVQSAWLHYILCTLPLPAHAGP